LGDIKPCPKDICKEGGGFVIGFPATEDGSRSFFAARRVPNDGGKLSGAYRASVIMKRKRQITVLLARCLGANSSPFGESVRVCTGLFWSFWS